MAVYIQAKMVEGQLRVTVVGFKSFSDDVVFGQQRVYAQVKCGKDSARCAGQEIVQHVAAFEEELKFSVKAEEGIEVQMYEQSPQGSRLLCSGSLSLSKVIKTGKYKVIVPLELFGRVMGEVKLRMRFTHSGMAPYAGAQTKLHVAVPKGILSTSRSSPHRSLPMCGPMANNPYPPQPIIGCPGWGHLPEPSGQQSSAMYAGSPLAVSPRANPQGYLPSSGAPLSHIPSGASLVPPPGYPSMKGPQRAAEGHQIGAQPYSTPMSGYMGGYQQGHQPGGYYGYPASGASPGGYPQQPLAYGGGAGAPGGMMVMMNNPSTSNNKKDSGPGLWTGVAAGALGMLVLDAIF